ncbi:MAG: 7-cyano-7-deazaguanine synthase [Bacteroidales bacterium]|nr:7-cyano-7-deazaguanine synthase [Bacteroidales bacterium]
MKIKVDTYRTRRIDKHETRLTIPITIEDTKGGVFQTAAIVQMTPIAYFNGKVPPVTYSLLYLSAIVYAIDRGIDRHRYSIDGWSRELDVDINLPEYELFQPVERQIDTMLSFLTGDYWNCHFVGTAQVRYGRYGQTNYFDGITQVNLFSGGMDSLIGAIDYMTDNPKGKLFLASHYDSVMRGPLSDQDRLKKIFRRKYSGKYAEMTAVMITPELSAELSCRSRSLMFLSIALIVASYANCKIVVPENGSVSLNFPLSPSRRASCSTRTTHPVFLKQYREVLKALGLTTQVENPYEKMTKGEMVQHCSDKDYLMSIVEHSNSCGKRGMHQHMYDNTHATHCGHCMPCMYRKAAMIGERDLTTYGNRFVTLYGKKGDKVAEDFFAMLNYLKTDLTKEQIRRELKIAGMTSFDDLEEYVDLVVRTRAELAAMIRADNNRTILRYLGW